MGINAERSLGVLSELSLNRNFLDNQGPESFPVAMKAEKSGKMTSVLVSTAADL